MHRHEVREHSEVNYLGHFNFLFTGWGSHVYDIVMVRLTRRLYQRVIDDLTTLRLVEGKVLDAGTGPGTLVRELARRLPGLQVYGIDLSEDMIGLARTHARREQLEERVHFESGDVAHLPYPDQSFDVVVSTISMHHWSELERPLRNSTGCCGQVDGCGSMTSVSSKYRQWRRRSPVRPLWKLHSNTSWCERVSCRLRSIDALPFRRRRSAITNKAKGGR